MAEYHSNASGEKETVYFLPWRGGAMLLPGVTVDSGGIIIKKIVLHFHMTASQNTFFVD